MNSTTFTVLINGFRSNDTSVCTLYGLLVSILYLDNNASNALPLDYITSVTVGSAVRFYANDTTIHLKRVA